MININLLKERERKRELYLRIILIFVEYKCIQILKSLTYPCCLSIIYCRIYLLKYIIQNYELIMLLIDQIIIHRLCFIILNVNVQSLFMKIKQNVLSQYFIYLYCYRSQYWFNCFWDIANYTLIFPQTKAKIIIKKKIFFFLNVQNINN